MIKPISIPPQPEGTPFEKFDNLFRKVVAVPKAAIDKEEKKWRRQQARRRTKKSA